MWNKLCPKFVKDFKGFDYVEINKKLMTMSKVVEVGMEEEDFIYLFEIQGAPNERGFYRAQGVPKIGRIRRSEGEEEEVKSVLDFWFLILIN